MRHIGATNIQAPHSGAVGNGSETLASNLLDGTLEKILEQPLETPGQTAECPDSAQPPVLPPLIAMGILDEPYAGRKGRAAHMVGEPPDIDRTPSANRQVEDLLRNLGHALQQGAAAAKHEA